MRKTTKPATDELRQLLNLELLENPSSVIFKMVMQTAIHRSKSTFGKSSSLLQLDQFLDNSGVLQVDGRLNRSE